MIEDSKKQRIGLIHYIYGGENTILVEEDIPSSKRKQVIAKFEELEKEIGDFIDAKQTEFSGWLYENQLESSMGWIAKKKKEL